MYCSQCGESLSPQARFCSACGARAGQPAPPSASADRGSVETEPTVVLRPRFVPSLTLAQLLPLQVFFTLWGGGFFGGFSMVGVQALKLPVPEWAPFAFFGTLFFVGIPVLAFRVAKRSAEQTEFRFFSDKLEYFEGFFNVEQKRIDLADVTEVSLTKGVLQSKHGLGTVHLSTRVGVVTSRRPGIRLANIEDPDLVYENVTKLVDRARGASSLRRAA